MDLTPSALVNATRRWRRRPRARYARVVEARSRENLPAALHPRRIYLVGSPTKWAVLECPCGRGHQIQLNMAHAGRPRWSLTHDARGRPSLSPSVDVLAEQRCHFWLRQGATHWV